MYLKLVDDYEKELEARGLKISPELHGARMDFAIWLSIRDDMKPFHPPEAAQPSVQRTAGMRRQNKRSKSKAPSAKVAGSPSGG